MAIELSRFEVPCVPTCERVRGGLAVVKAAWHGVLETMWLLCDEPQQVGCP